MPEIRIRYEDDSDRMPYAEIAEIVKAAGKYLPVTEFEWIRDDDLDDEDAPEQVVNVTPDLSGIDSAFTRAVEQGARFGRFT